MNKFKLSKRLVAVIVAALLIVTANALLTKRTAPFQRFQPYQTASEIIKGKDWNWGLAFLIRGTKGNVVLDHLGNLEGNGIFIPTELAQINHLELDSTEPPLVLSAEYSLALSSVSGNTVTVSKTRCLHRDYKYCAVKIMSNDSINAAPENFVGVRLSANVFGLVEKQLLERVIGPVN